MTEETASISRTIETKGQAQIACLLVIVIGIQVIPGLKMGNIIPMKLAYSTFMIINFIYQEYYVGKVKIF